MAKTTKTTKKPKYKQGETLGTVEKIKSKHELIADKIIESLESNKIPWKKPWNSLAAANLVTKKEYRGINAILLSMVPTKYPFFATFNQIKAQGGSILKGSKSVPVFFYSPIKKIDENYKNEDESELSVKSYWLMKQYSVFTMEQTEGVDFSMFIDPVIDFQPVMKAENLVNAFLQDQLLRIDGAQGAAYNPLKDLIVMPDKNQFHSVDSYYSTIFHEMIHSTGSEKRLKRAGFSIGEYHRFGSKGYAFEELVAEFGAAMLASYCGVDTSLESGQNAAYINSWLKVIKEDPAICYKAASKAQAAVDFILKAAGFNAFGEDEQLNNEAV
jgi:antirestriction protein ArdC